MGRTAALLAGLLVLGAASCGGGTSETQNRSAAGPRKEEADAFVAELLNGRPEKAAELLSTQHSGLEFELPGVSIELQERHYRVVRSKRRDRTTFVYELKGRQNGRPKTAYYEVKLEFDLDDWRVKDFDPVKTY